MSKLQEIQKQFHEFDQKTYPGNNSMLMALGVAEEAGELCHHILKRAQGLGVKADHDDGIKDAIADITVFCMQLCSFEGFDWEDNFVKVSETVLQRVRSKIEQRYKETKGK
jgi:NTP pyrophosphatase (non-canonical NTP hydrolase)